MANSLLRYPSARTDTLTSLAALLITNEHLCGDEISRDWWITLKAISQLDCEADLGCRIKQARGQTYLARFIFVQSAPSLPVLSYRLQLSDCGDLR